MTPPLGLAHCPNVLTIKEVCRELQISESYYYLLARHGQFPIRPLPLKGRVVRYSRAAVQAFADGVPAKLQRVG